MRLIQAPVALALTLALPGVSLAAVPPPPSGPAAQPAEPAPAGQPEMSDEEKMDKAKALYVAAEGLAADGNWAAAVPLYEEAYYLVPGKHGFAYKVGVASWESKDCNKANTYLKHFLTYGDPEKQGDKFDEAKRILGEISISGCATEDTSGGAGGGGAGGGAGTGSGGTADANEIENPLEASSRDVRTEEAKKARKAKKDEKRGLLLGGAVLTGIGFSGVVVGLAGLGVASSSAGELRDLSSNGTTSGFPQGDYACRDVPANECPFKLESRLRTGNVLGYVGLGVGGAALVGGVSMLAIYFVNKKKHGGAQEEVAPTEGEAGVELTGIAPTILPGGAGAMAEIRF